MDQFYDALVNENKNMLIPEELDFFGKLIGSWKITYLDNSNSSLLHGEWHFARILEGMAIQDVIVLPNFEYGTTLRIYNPNKNIWDIVYCYTGRVIRLEARKENGMIILTNIEDARKKWVFVKIENDKFHWQDILVDEHGKWDVKYDLFAERIM